LDEKIKLKKNDIIVKKKKLILNNGLFSHVFDNKKNVFIKYNDKKKKILHKKLKLQFNREVDIEEVVTEEVNRYSSY